MQRKAQQTNLHYFFNSVNIYEFSLHASYSARCWVCHGEANMVPVLWSLQTLITTTKRSVLVTIRLPILINSMKKKNKGFERE